MPRLRGATHALDLILGAIPPASGAVVMGTGIVSIALSLDGHESLSRILLVITGGVWLALGVLLPARAMRDHTRFRSDVRTPAAFTAVAGTAVLGTRLTVLGWHRAGGILLATALILWLAILGPVLLHWMTPAVGASFILTVGTESLAVLGATLALAQHTEWLLVASLVPFVLGLGFYVFVLCSFDFRQLTVGIGDHWVTGGALAISTVAAGRITLAYEHLESSGDAVDALKSISLVLWVLALSWLPVLLVAELCWPRPHYSVRRWSTVFPVGMYAACSFVVGAIGAAPTIIDFARVWVWVSVAVWAVVATGLARAAVRALAEARELQPSASSRPG